MKVPVSVIIPILNEEKNLPRALNSVAWANEIFVVDSNSTDRSCAIAEERGAKVVQFQFKKPWPKKKNWALEQLPFKNEWVFILDADEELLPDAEEEFHAICSSTNSGFDGYFINRRFMFMGKWLQHAYYPNWNLRLFRHSRGRYERLSLGDTHSGDNEVHEHICLKGKAGRLKTEMNHYAFPDVYTFVEKHNRYSNWEAQVSMEALEKKDVNLNDSIICLKRKLKTLSRNLPLRPLLRFLYVYVIQRGFLDGLEGYYFARLHGIYEFLSICKTYELRNNQR